MTTFNVPGDMVLTADRKSVVLVTGPERVKQRVRIGIQTLLGTYKFNLDAGIPWLVWLDKSQRVPIESELRKHLLTYPEIQAVTSLNLTVDKRTRLLFVSFVAQLRSREAITDTVSIAPITS